ncbi:MAG: PepSY domain-containing protein [Candidatus Dormibacteria bacterium]
MRLVVTAGAVGTLAAVGAAGAIALTQGGPHATVPTSVNLVSASGPAAAAADNAAVSYVDQKYPGSATAVVLKTESDTEHGIPVYDVQVTAPNGSTYSLSVQVSNDTVLSAQLSETKTSPAPAATGAPVATKTPEATQTPEPAKTPEPKSTPEATQTPQPSATSKDSPDNSNTQGSQDQQQQQSKTSKDS